MRVLSNLPRLCLLSAALAAVLTAWSGCASDGSPAVVKGDPPVDPTNHLFDPLIRGDRIEISLRGAPAEIKPSVQEIAGDGSISLENVGRLPAAGLTPEQLEKEIYTNFVPSIYIHLNVNVIPTDRYFYVGGQIKGTSGGRQKYSSGMTLTRAIQAAGDFNDYAKRTQVRLTRMRDGTSQVYDCIKILKHKAPDPEVAPGDQIFVPMRRF
jgi:protein involved in polysaccharide export with SLBB domain